MKKRVVITLNEVLNDIYKLFPIPFPRLVIYNIMKKVVYSMPDKKLEKILSEIEQKTEQNLRFIRTGNKK